MAFCGVQRVVGAGGIWTFGCGGSSEDRMYVCKHVCVTVCACMSVCTHVHICVKIRLSRGQVNTCEL